MNLKLEHINKAFESKARLGIMSALMVNDEIDFTTLKSLLDLTDEKQFIGRKPNTTFQMTESGREAFSEHLKALEDFLKISLGN